MYRVVDYLVEKSNLANTMGSFNMPLSEFRFFLMYLSKINEKDRSTRTVRLNISEFESIFGIKFGTKEFIQQIQRIMSRTVEIYHDDEKVFLTLYSRIRWKKSDTIVIEISCNDEILSYLFKLKGDYTAYMLENISKLNSAPKIKLYEVLKQYESKHSVKLNLEELKSIMRCKSDTPFPFFRRDTLDPTIKDINKLTDIEISYEKIVVHRKVVALKFTIQNKIAKAMATYKDERSQQEKIDMLYVKCNREYSMEELQSLYVLVESMNMSISVDSYIFAIYLNIKAENRVMDNLYRYTLSTITNDIKDFNLKMMTTSNLNSEFTTNHFGNDDATDDEEHDLSDFMEILESEDLPFD